MDGYFNYGNILQKYALQHTLKKFTKQTEILNYKDANEFLMYGYWSKKVQSKSIVENLKRFDQYGIIKNSKIKEFETRYTDTRFDFDYIEDLVDEYDFFVVGSDQIWNPYWTADRFFLTFAPREKRIAYAASIGLPKIPEEKKEYFRKNISGFDYLSVREEGAVKIIKELTGQEALLLPDPTLVLTPEEWLNVSRKPAWIKGKYANGYILTYYLREDPPPELKELSKKMNLPLVNLMDARNYWHFVNSPEEFIWLFANASLIYTNSFHGAVFSILFKKPFVNREIVGDKSGINMSLRIPSLLKTFELESRIARPENNFKIDNLMEIDYNTREKVLLAEREKAFNFLSNALGVKPKENFLKGDEKNL